METLADLFKSFDNGNITYFRKRMKTIKKDKLIDIIIKFHKEKKINKMF